MLNEKNCDDVNGAAVASPKSGRRVALITGASSGIGKACALELLGKDWIVYGAARRTDRLQALMAQGLRPLALDVTLEESRQEAVKAILAEAGRLDALVNSAGYGSYGAVEDVPLDEARHQFEVNVFGLAGMCQAVLPVMRSQKSGRIVNISSMGGRIYTPMGGWYFATKHAVEALSDALRQEVKHFGIQVSIIQPGVIASEWVDTALKALEQRSGQGAYSQQAEKLAKVMRFAYRKKLVGRPESIAKLVCRAVTSSKPRLRYAAEIDAKVLLAFRKYAPDGVFDAVVSLITNP